MTRVVSIRTPATLIYALETDATRWKVRVPTFLDFLLRCSFACAEALCRLQDSGEFRNSKLDVRLPTQTFERLSAVCQQFSISPTVYIRTLLQNLYVAEKLELVERDKRYTLAVRHDQT